MDGEKKDRKQIIIDNVLLLIYNGYFKFSKRILEEFKNSRLEHLILQNLINSWLCWLVEFFILSKI